MLPVTRRSWLRSGWPWHRPPRQRSSERAGVSAEQDQSSHGAMEHAAHRMGPVGRVSTEAFNPASLPARVELLGSRARRNAAATTAKRRGPTARCCASTRSSRSIARSRSRPACSSRPGRSTARCPDRPSARPKAIACASRSSTQGSHPHTIHFHGWHPAGDGRVAARTPGDARRAVRLRVRRRAVRPASLSLPRRAAEAAHPQGPLRRVHRRSEDAASAGRRARHGDERLRHQLRRRQRGLRASTRSPTTSCTSRSRSRSASSSACISSTSPSSI